MRINSNSEKILSKNAENTIKKLLTDALKEESISIIEITWKELKKAAQDLITGNKTLMRNKQIIDSQFLKQILSHQVESNSVNLIMSHGSQKAYIQRARYLLAFHFDEILSKYLGKLPTQGAIVYEDEKGEITTYTFPLKEMAKLLTADNKISLSPTQKMQLQGEQHQLEQKLSKQLGIGSVYEKIWSAYKGTVNRLNRYYEVVQAPQKQGGILLWKIGGIWQAARIINLGDVKEAYTALLVAQIKEKNRENYNSLLKSETGTPLYYSHEIISEFYKGYISKVDNLPAIVEEDVIGDEFQYAVKGENARAPSLNQYLQMASFIVNLPDNFNKQQIEDYLSLKKKGIVQRNIELPIDKLEAKAQETINELIASFEKK